MPRATVVLAPEKFMLKTLADPEDPGFVSLRRMSYGELLQSQDMAFQIQVQAQNRASGRDAEPDVGVKLSQGAITDFQMALCVVEHNLTDEQDRPLNFKSALDVHRLDPNVGQEITSLIEKLHNWREEYPNSQEPSTSDSSTPSEPEAEMASPQTPQQLEASQTT